MDLDRYKTLTLTRDGRILTIAIDNGPMNAVDDDLHRELARVFVAAQDDDESDLIVLTGAGRAFCAGGDMAWFPTPRWPTKRSRTRRGTAKKPSTPSSSGASRSSRASKFDPNSSDRGGVPRRDPRPPGRYSIIPVSRSVASAKSSMKS